MTSVFSSLLGSIALFIIAAANPHPITDRNSAYVALAAAICLAIVIVVEILMRKGLQNEVSEAAR